MFYRTGKFFFSLPKETSKRKAVPPSNGTAQKKHSQGKNIFFGKKG
jgi:hypothetical protein